MGSQKALQQILELIAAALPFESIYSDMCSDKRAADTADQQAEILTLASRIMEVTKLNIETVMALDPIGRFPQYHDILRKELG